MINRLSGSHHPCGRPSSASGSATKRARSPSSRNRPPAVASHQVIGRQQLMRPCPGYTAGGAGDRATGGERQADLARAVTRCLPAAARRARIPVPIAVGVERYRFGRPQAGDLLVAQGCADLPSTRLDQTDNDGAPVGKSACAGQAFGDDGVERGLDLAVARIDRRLAHGLFGRLSVGFGNGQVGAPLVQQLLADALCFLRLRARVSCSAANCCWVFVRSSAARSAASTESLRRQSRRTSTCPRITGSPTSTATSNTRVDLGGEPWRIVRHHRRRALYCGTSSRSARRMVRTGTGSANATMHPLSK